MKPSRLLRSHPAILALAAILAGCQRGPGGDQPQAVPSAPPAIEQVKERGPVKVTLRVDPPEPTFADRVRFTIEAAAKKGTLVTLPSPGENLGEFIIKDYDAPPDRVTADVTEYRRAYTLEFLTSGDYTIPPMTISFHEVDSQHSTEVDSRQSTVDSPGKSEATDPTQKAESDPSGTGADQNGDSSPEFKIVTDEIKIKVKPLADDSSIKELAPIAPPAEPALIAPGLFWPLVIVGAAAAVAALAFAAVRLLRRERPAPPPIPPHERAYRELEWLLGQGFVERGELKEFYFHLSRILREYIEGRFGLRAPELTTEEFLVQLIGPKLLRQAPAPGDGQGIPPEHQPLLRDFLQRADLVKFARYAPGKEEIEGSFEASKRFIEATIAPAGAASGGGADGRPRAEAVH